MPNYPAPVLEIVYGSTTINLLSRGKGWHLTDFRPRTAELKNGANWQSSPLSDGRQPVSYRYDNIIDTWTVSADGYDEDGIIELAQELERAGVTALDYWTSDWTSTPVYIKARGPKETNTRYAIIHQIRIPEYGDQYRQPFFGMSDPVMEGISVIIEHGQWQNVAPGDQECVAVSSVFEWEGVARWGELWDAISGNVTCFLRLASGRILAGTDVQGGISYTDEGGAVGGLWNPLASLGGVTTDVVHDLAQSPATGYVYAAVSGGSGVRGLYHSTDDGDNWTLTDGNQFDAYEVEIDSNGIILYTGNTAGGRRLNTNNSLLQSYTSLGGSPFYEVKFYDAASDRWLWGGTGSIVETASTIGSALNSKTVSGNVVGSALASNQWYFVTSSGQVYVLTVGSNNTPTLLHTISETCHSMLRDTDGNLWVGADTGLYLSADNGASWSKDFVSVTPIKAIAQLPNGKILLGQEDSIYASTESASTVSAGSEATCDNQVYASNKVQNTNLTHIFISDVSVGSFTSIYPMSAYPVAMLPATPANNDAIYFGIDINISGVNSGPFSSLVFDLSSPFVGWTTVAWEYWNGSAWGALTVKDNTLSLLQTGVNSVHWVPPSNWATTTVNSVTGYWVRFRVDAIATSPEPPAQQNRNIYAVVNPYVEIAADQIGGDIPALARIRIENVSDRDGPGGSAPDLYTNRVVMGLRSVDRGALFTAYLNAADEQNPVGVTVTAGTDTSFANAVGAPSGRIAQWSPTGTGSWVTILTFSLAATIATQYYGTFRVFLRARQSGGTAGQMQLRLRTSTGSGGVSITTDAQVFANTNDHQIIDFGQLTIPLSAYLKATELGDTLTLAIQGNTSSATPDANLYDLVLIPVDEWAADLTDGENSAASALSSGFYLDVDSVSFPKRQLRNAVKATGTNYTKAIWQQIANGPAILQANARQRLWLLSLRTASAGSSDWRSEPDVVHRVQMWSAERYRWARGSR